MMQKRQRVRAQKLQIAVRHTNTIDLQYSNDIIVPNRRAQHWRILERPLAIPVFTRYGAAG